MAAETKNSLPSPRPPTSAQVINEIEQHYFRKGLPTSEYAAVRDHTDYLDTVWYAKVRSVNLSLMERQKIMDTIEVPEEVKRIRRTIDIVKSRNKAGVYGKNVEKLLEVGMHNKNLMKAYTAEGVPDDELVGRATIVFHKIRDRLENPPGQ